MRFFSPPGEALVDGARHHVFGHLDELHLLPKQLRKVDRVEFFLASVLTHRVDGRAQEMAVRDAGNLDRVLEGQEDALARSYLGIHLEQILAAKRTSPSVTS